MAGDPQMPLRGAGRIGGAECRWVQFRACGQVVRDGVLCQIRRDVAACVLQQRDEVVGGMAERGTLEVEHADAADAVALRQPEQVAGEEVAMDEADRTGRTTGASIGFKCRGEVLAGGVGARDAEHRRPPPVEQCRQRGGGHRRRVPERQIGWGFAALHGDQNVHGQLKQSN